MILKYFYLFLTRYFIAVASLLWQLHYPNALSPFYRIGPRLSSRARTCLSRASAGTRTGVWGCVCDGAASPPDAWRTRRPVPRHTPWAATRAEREKEEEEDVRSCPHTGDSAASGASPATSWVQCRRGVAWWADRWFSGVAISSGVGGASRIASPAPRACGLLWACLKLAPPQTHLLFMIVCASCIVHTSHFMTNKTESLTRK